jgi:hypothetical protein
VAYPELVNNPRKIIQTVYEQAGYRAPDNLNQAINAFLAGLAPVEEALLQLPVAAV